MAELGAANIQVFGPEDEGPDDLARRVVRALKETLAAEGYEPVAPGDASSRELAIIISTQKGRVTVLDEASDGNRLSLEGLGRRLSQALDALTVSVVSAHHELAIALHGGGATLSMLPDDAHESELHDAWGELLAGGNTPKDLGAIWLAPGSPLLRTADVLCVEQSLMTVSHAALGRLGRAGVRLRFREQGGMFTAKGPRLRGAAMPGFGASPGPGTTFKVGVVLQNRGTAAKGIEVTLRGRLLTEEWLEVHSATLETRGFKEEQRPKFRVVRNDRVYRACFENAPLPAAGSSDVLNLLLECQLTRSLPKAEAMQASFDPVESASGGCSVDIAIDQQRL